MNGSGASCSRLATRDSMESYLKSASGLLLPQHGAPDKRPRRIEVPIRDGKVNPDGAILIHADTIGVSREEAVRLYRKRGYDPVFVDVT